MRPEDKEEEEKEEEESSCDENQLDAERGENACMGGGRGEKGGER